ncbi:MAG: DEAD/DEAH box helicase, partial [Promethearchaeota archaeon]
MDINDLRTGIIIKANNWKEPIEVKKVEEMGTYVRIIGSTIESRSHIDQIISIEEIDSLVIDKVESKFDSPCVNVFLAFEAKRFKYASLYDPLLAINISKVDPLPHQIEAVYGYVLQLPRIRFLIADDPGAGKTIMAGLIIKELKLRNLIKRVLIIVPGHLKDQWRRELKDRFKESYIVMDRAFINAHYGENAWEKENQIITSIDFAKREDIIPSINSTYFDLVIVDEAHKMSAYKYGEQTHKTGRYKLGEVVSNNSENLLFLTATPHRGDPENFRLFLDLLEPGFFATQKMLEDSIQNKDNPLFIRRIKEDLKDFEGKPLFLPRNIQTLSFRLSDEEKLLYNEVSKYVKVQYNKALAKDGRRYIAFALVILQRRLASSTYALLKSLERRKEKLESILKKAETTPVVKVKIFDFDDIEDMSEEERWKEEEMWETLSVAENRDELKREIQILESLIEKAIEIVRSEEEIKLLELKKTLQRLEEEFQDEKIIVFTEARDTLEYLEKKLNSWGYTVNTIHGGMKLEARVEAESIFKNEKQVLVATEAAGEGINLQFCHLMINYDIPWNPNRLEQRMGRIHRYGQNKEVFIFNLVAADTREGRVINRLFEKLQEIKTALGSDKVFDVINEIIYGKNLAQLLLEAAASARDIEQIISEIDIEVDEEYISNVKEKLGESLATRYIDYTRIKEMAEKAREFKLIPEYTEAFFKKAFNFLEGKERERKDGFLAIDRIPYELKMIAEEDDFRRKYGKLINKYPKITFDKDIAFKNPEAEFISFDHPLFESLLEHINRNFISDLRNGTVFND